MSALNRILISLVVAIAIYINYPAPPLSEQLQKWKRDGKYFQFKDHNIFYKDSKGTGKEEDVLLIFHGFPTQSFDYNKIWDDLNSIFGRVIIADFLGFGFSDKPRDHAYSIMEEADYTELLLKKLNIDQVHILAHDMGDTVAQELIHRQNKLNAARKKGDLEILSVCLMNGGILPETIAMRWGQKLLLRPWLSKIFMRLSNGYVMRHSLAEVFGDRTQPTAEEFDDYYAAIRHKDGHLVTAAVMQYLPQRFANRDRWVGALQDTRIPLHLIFGPSDPVNPLAFLKAYKKLVPNSGITELPAHIGHYPQLEDPPGVVKAYKGFFESL